MDKAGNGFCFFVRSRKVRERYFCCKNGGTIMAIFEKTI